MDFAQHLSALKKDLKNKRTATDLRQAYLATSHLYPLETSKVLRKRNFFKLKEKFNKSLKGIKSYSFIQSLGIILVVDKNGEECKYPVPKLADMLSLFEYDSLEENLLLGAILESEELYHLFIIGYCLSS